MSSFFSYKSGSSNIRDVNIALQNIFKFQKYYDQTNIENYNKLFSDLSGFNYTYSFGSGRMAFYSLLKSLSVKKDDEVIIPAYTCVVVANAIKYIGAKPIYVDINLNNFGIDNNNLKQKITNKTKVICVQHTYGIYSDVKEIKKIIEGKEIFIIEDLAHLLNHQFRENNVGAYSDACYTSTDHTKIINTFLGGMAFTNNIEISKKIKKIYDNSNFLSRFSIFKILFSFIIENILIRPKNYKVGIIFYKIFRKFKFLYSFKDDLITKLPLSHPYPSKLSAPQALIGINQLNKIEKNVKHRKKISILINKYIGNFSIELLNNTALLRYPVLVNNRSDIIKILQTIFENSIWFTTILHNRKNNFNIVDYQLGSCPNAEFACKHVINFPTHEKIDIKAVELFFEKNHSIINNNIISIK